MKVVNVTPTKEELEQEQYHEYHDVGEEILQVLVKHIQWAESYSDYKFLHMEIQEEPYVLTCTSRYISKSIPIGVYWKIHKKIISEFKH